MSDRTPRSFDQLVAEASERPTTGWDFSWLDDRMRIVPLPWDYTALAVAYARRSPDLLDLGTGGGEWLAGLLDRPPRTVATEAWAPNVPVAAERLRPWGVAVVRVAAAPDNNFQVIGQDAPRLPFREAPFQLVLNRHESFVATELTRVLACGGHFITQQLGDGLFSDFRALFDVATGEEQPFTLAMAVAQLEAAGLHIEQSGVGHEAVAFADVGALAWYLRMVPWTVPGFSIDLHRERLEDLHRRIRDDGPLVFNMPGFYVVAVKPVAE